MLPWYPGLAYPLLSRIAERCGLSSRHLQPCRFKSWLMSPKLVSIVQQSAYLDKIVAASHSRWLVTNILKHCLLPIIQRVPRRFKHAWHLDSVIAVSESDGKATMMPILPRRRRSILSRIGRKTPGSLDIFNCLYALWDVYPETIYLPIRRRLSCSRMKGLLHTSERD